MSTEMRRFVGAILVPVVALMTVMLLTLAPQAFADDPMPPNLCTTQILSDEVMEWMGGGVDPDPVGLEWRALDAAGNVIGYGNADDEYQALLRATKITKRNSVCAQYQPPDLVLPW